MGRLTLNVLLSFAQFEREVTTERIRDKIAASKRKRIWMGGTVSLGYQCSPAMRTACLTSALMWYSQVGHMVECIVGRAIAFSRYENTGTVSRRG